MLTAEDLKQIAALNAEVIASTIAAAIAESRKPLPPTEKELAELAQMQQQRVANAAGVIAQAENKRAVQRICNHEHKRKEGGGTHGVWVRDEDPRSPGYIYCQKCEARVRPGMYDKDGLPYQRDRTAHFDTELFNKLFQECGEQTVLG
jgi:hypothetical protein